MRPRWFCANSTSTLIVDPRLAEPTARAALEAKGAVLTAYTFAHDGAPPTTHYFVETTRGVVPRLLESLLAARADAKAAMKTAEGPAREYFDNLQGALKVSANSVYGSFGVAVGKGRLSCLPVAAAVTTNGRRLIMAAKDIVEAEFKQRQARVVYGDTGESRAGESLRPAANTLRPPTARRQTRSWCTSPARRWPRRTRSARRWRPR